MQSGKENDVGSGLGNKTLRDNIGGPNKASTPTPMPNAVILIKA